MCSARLHRYNTRRRHSQRDSPSVGRAPVGPGRECFRTGLPFFRDVPVAWLPRQWSHDPQRHAHHSSET